jgi:hypothetical protein
MSRERALVVVTALATLHGVVAPASIPAKDIEALNTRLMELAKEGGCKDTHCSFATTQGGKANGWFATAIGASTKAYGNYSFATGKSTEAVGWFATAMGDSTKATGDYSTALGHHVKASGFAQVALGMYNEAGADGVLRVGVGDDHNSRHDALRVYGDGTLYLAKKGGAAPMLDVQGEIEALKKALLGSTANPPPSGAVTTNAEADASAGFAALKQELEQTKQALAALTAQHEALAQQVAKLARAAPYARTYASAGGPGSTGSSARPGSSVAGSSFGKWLGG